MNARELVRLRLLADDFGAELSTAFERYMFAVGADDAADIEREGVATLAAIVRFCERRQRREAREAHSA